MCNKRVKFENLHVQDSIGREKKEIKALLWEFQAKYKTKLTKELRAFIAWKNSLKNKLNFPYMINFFWIVVWGYYLFTSFFDDTISSTFGAPDLQSIQYFVDMDTKYTSILETSFLVIISRKFIGRFFRILGKKRPISLKRVVFRKIGLFFVNHWRAIFFTLFLSWLYFYYIIFVPFFFDENNQIIPGSIDRFGYGLRDIRVALMKQAAPKKHIVYSRTDKNVRYIYVLPQFIKLPQIPLWYPEEIQDIQNEYFQKAYRIPKTEPLTKGEKVFNRDHRVSCQLEWEYWILEQNRIKYRPVKVPPRLGWYRDKND